MIQLISKWEFYKNIKKDTKFTKVFKILCHDRYFSYSEISFFTYLLVDNLYYIIYVNRIHYLLIPSDYNFEKVSESVMANFCTINSSEWKLFKISDKITHSLNTFCKIYSDINIRNEILDSDATGTWNLINDRTGEVLEVQLRKAIDTYYNEIENNNRTKWLISYEEKERIPTDERYILEKDEFLEQIINGCKKDI